MVPIDAETRHAYLVHLRETAQTRRMALVESQRTQRTAAIVIGNLVSVVALVATSSPELYPWITAGAVALSLSYAVAEIVRR